MTGYQNPNIQAILLDIEGTTTPISFVVETLFPYARRHLRKYLEQEHDEALFQRFRAEWDVDRNNGAPSWADAPRAARLESIAAYSDWLMDRGRKSTALKILQGRIWEQGYTRGELVGAVFADVSPAFERWRSSGLQIGIFSSGSALAQKLLFRHSSAGDLSGHLRWYFDTTIGAKGDSESYRRIAAAMAISPDAILFVSDSLGELDAARSAGLYTLLSIRPGNAPVVIDHEHPTVRSFDSVLLATQVDRSGTRA